MASTQRNTSDVTVVLMRHGQTDWNAQQRFQGRSDIPLNEQGIEQARSAAQRWADTAFDAVLASPLIRAHRTAELVSASHGLEIITDERIAETQGGEWEGMTFSLIKARWPEEYTQWRLPNMDVGPLGGETPRQSGTRTANAIRQFIEARPDVRRLLVVSHGNTLRAATHLLIHGEDSAYADTPRLDNCQAHVITTSDIHYGDWRLIDANV